MLIKIIKSIIEYEKACMKISKLLGVMKKEDIVKIKIDKKYLNMIYILVAHGIDTPEKLMKLIKSYENK